MDKIIKLSEAMRLGATYGPQCFGYYFYGKKSCALGSVLQAINRRDMKLGRYQFLRKRFPELRKYIDLNQLPSNIALKSPDTGNIMVLSSLIVHLNDIEGWTREQIADLLEDMGY